VLTKVTAGLEVAMKRVDKLITVAFAAAFTVSSALGVFAQTQNASSDKTRQRQATQSPLKEKNDSKSGSQKPGQTTSRERLEPDDTSRMPSDVPDETQANRQEQIAEENEVARSYNNFFNTYRLGPEDVISISVFGQERYSRSGVPQVDASPWR
jgi:protein involved in polysaccharide export with SLBB domain